MLDFLATFEKYREILFLIIGTLLGFLGSTYFRRLQTAIGRAVEKDAVAAVFIGPGGAGKTSLIMQLVGTMQATDTVTTEVNLWHRKIDTKGREIDLTLIDTVGQRSFSNLGEVVSAVGKTKAGGVVPKIGSLVIVVDVVGIADITADTNKIVPHVDRERVERTLSEYNDTIFQIFSGLLGQGGRIVLFINKLDRLSGSVEEAREKAETAYKPLIEQLRTVRGTELRVISGSARRGDGVPKLLDLLTGQS